jgi:hypothetical protein
MQLSLSFPSLLISYMMNQSTNQSQAPHTAHDTNLFLADDVIPLHNTLNPYSTLQCTTALQAYRTLRSTRTVSWQTKSFIFTYTTLSHHSIQSQAPHTAHDTNRFLADEVIPRLLGGVVRDADAPLPTLPPEQLLDLVQYVKAYIVVSKVRERKVEGSFASHATCVTMNPHKTNKQTYECVCNTPFLQPQVVMDPASLPRIARDLREDLHVRGPDVVLYGGGGFTGPMAAARQQLLLQQQHASGGVEGEGGPMTVRGPDGTVVSTMAPAGPGWCYHARFCQIITCRALATKHSLYATKHSLFCSNFLSLTLPSPYFDPLLYLFFIFARRKGYNDGHAARFCQSLLAVPWLPNTRSLFYPTSFPFPYLTRR